MSVAINNQPRFEGIRTLVVTGERGEESSARAKYKDQENHRCHRLGTKVSRHVEHYRPVLDWKEELVWDIIQKYNVRVHPAYYLGFSRVSCQFCIFGNADQFASARYLDPERGDLLADLEDDFGVTLKRKKTLRDLYGTGDIYPALLEDAENEKLSQSSIFYKQIIMPEGTWYLPAGAFGNSCGPS